MYFKDDNAEKGQKIMAEAVFGYSPYAYAENGHIKQNIRLMRVDLNRCFFDNSLKRIAILKSRMRREKHLNRRMEIYAELKKLKLAIRQLR